jgi:hypothetical protein
MEEAHSLGPARCTFAIDCTTSTGNSRAAVWMLLKMMVDQNSPPMN